MLDKKVIDYKIVILGRSYVGKSSVLIRFTDDSFVESYAATVGVDFKFRSFALRDQNFKLQIWDTAGQERYQTIAHTFYKKAHGIVAVFDLSSKSSFEELIKVWVPQIEEHCRSGTLVMIMGNKSDLDKKREVSTEEGKAYADSKGYLYFEVSAKKGTNIQEAFFALTSKMYDAQLQGEGAQNLVTGQQLQANQQGVTNKPSCC